MFEIVTVIFFLKKLEEQVATLPAVDGPASLTRAHLAVAALCAGILVLFTDQPPIRRGRLVPFARW